MALAWFLLLVLICAGAALANRLSIPESVIFCVIGLATGFLPDSRNSPSTRMSPWIVSLNGSPIDVSRRGLRHKCDACMRTSRPSGLEAPGNGSSHADDPGFCLR